MLPALLGVLTSGAVVALSGAAAVVLLTLDLARREVARRAVSRYHAYGIAAAVLFGVLVTLRFITNV